MKPSGKHLLLWPALLATVFFAGQAAAFDPDSNQPIRVTADSARLDEGLGIAIYTGDVKLIQGEARLEADEVELQRNNQGIQRIEATGSPAHYFQPARGQQKATDASARSIVWSAEDDIVTLRKQARIQQGASEFRGDVIQYDARQRIVTAKGGESAEGASGRVEMVIQPGNTQQPNSGQSNNETGSDGSSQGQ